MRADPADLLADLTWLRQLATRLAGGADGDDLAQDATMVALGKPRPVGEGLRPWLVVTARNIWRRRQRDERRLRERHAALEAPEPEATAEAALERLDTLALVAELVRGLPDPYRATVLARYFDGRTATEIAAETGVPAGTVRWRLKEALARLRQAMDERHGGDRRRWTALFLPLPRSARPWPALALPVGLAGLATVAVFVGVAPHGPRAHELATSSSPPPRAGLTSRPVRLATTETPDGDATVTGVVVDPAGRPVAGAAVVLFPTRETRMATDPTRVDRLEGRAITDGEGRFVLDGRLPGSYELTATHERFGPAHADVSIGAGERRRVELRMSVAGELLSGTIRDTVAGPVIGARLTATEFPGRGPQLSFGTVSGAGGRYAMRLPPGHWHLGVWADGYAYAWQEIALDGPVSRDVALPAASAIAGRVVDGDTGAPVGGALVRLDRPGAPGGRATSTDAAGRFSFGTAWPPGRSRLTASAGERMARVELAPSADPAVRSPVELALQPGGAVAGRVVDARGRALRGAVVRLFDGFRQTQPVREVKTDGDGRYRIAGLSPDQTWVGVEAARHAPARRSVVPGAMVDFSLENEVTLVGSVTREDGRPLSSAELQLSLLGPESNAPLLAYRRVPLGPQGTFRIDGLAAGSFVADVQSRGEGSGRFQGSLVAAEHRRVTWRLAGPEAPDGRGRDAVNVGPF